MTVSYCDQRSIFLYCDPGTCITVILNCSDIGTICPQDQETDWPGEGDEEKWFGVKRISARDGF